MKYWTKAWNPVVGCTKCAPACSLCYAEQLHNQRHKAFLDGKAGHTHDAVAWETGK